LRLRSYFSILTRRRGALAAAGCEFEYDPDAIDDYGPTVFGKVTGVTALDEDAVRDWLNGIVDPFGGDIYEWGLVSETERRTRRRRCGGKE
jgi:hypothetical protein